MYISCIQLLLLMSISAVAVGQELRGSALDMNAAMISLSHSQNSYCGSPDTYLTRSYSSGYFQGFVPTYRVNADHDTQGYIGYNSAQQTIFVVFRGSESISNWFANLDAILTNYPLCSGCSVHKGFYTSEQSAIGGIITELKSLKSKFPSYNIIITGHSLGAAIATLVAADLKNIGIGPVRLFNFGSPRIGNTEFATWFSSTITDRNRITHHKDIVVHSPMHERFTHISNEYYEPDNNVNPVNVNICNGYEDNNCSYQWHITSIDDHLWYLGMPLGSGGKC